MIFNPNKDFFMNEVKVAIIGFGGIARAHYKGYKILKKEQAPVRLLAVCDVDPSKFDSDVKINIASEENGLSADIACYTSVDDLIASEDFNMADICLPSFLHKEYTVKLLKAGKHVLCEKPMALSTEQCEEMLVAAKKSGNKLMIGQCLRFNATYSFLKDIVESGKYGKMRHLFMDRRSAQPIWGFEHWFEDTERSGGCILDMHIHDVDMARYLLGEPKAVSTMAYDTGVRWSVENTRLYYDGTMVVINGSWDESATCKFYSGYRARFDDATVICDNGVITVYPENGEIYKPEIKHVDHMAEEIRYFASTILDDTIKNEKNPPSSAAATVKLIEKLRESAEANGAIITL